MCTETTFHTQNSHTKFTHMQQKQLFLNFLSLRFHLRQRKHHVPTTIYAVFSLLGKTYRINTTIKVLPSQWHTATQRAIISSTFCKLDNNNNLIANNQLNRIEFDFAEKKIYLCENLDCNYLYHLILAINPHHMARKKVAEVQQTATEILYRILAEKVSNGQITESSLQRVYKPYITNLKVFLEKNKIKNELNSLNFETLEKYSIYLKKTQTATQARKILNIWQSWLKKELATAHVGYCYDTQIDSLKITVQKIAKKDQGEKYIALTPEEIQRIYALCDDKLNDTNISNLTLYRDMFVLQCLVGCRVSDLEQAIDPANNDGEYITFYAKKTERKNTEKCLIPLRLYPQICEIIARHEKTTLYNSLLSAHNKYNEAIKELGRLAQITEVVVRNRQAKGGKIVTEKQPKYKRLTSHCARHTFITNAVRYLGLKKEDIINITGHSTTKQIDDVYCNLTDDDRKAQLSNAIAIATNKDNTPIPTATPVQTPPTNTVVGDIPEAYTVLNFLGANEDDYLGTNDMSQLIRMIGRYEGRIIDSFADKIDIEKLKELFNRGGKISERKKALHQLFSEIQQQENI